MNRLFLTTVFLLAAAFPVAAQDGSIEFGDAATWEQVVETARRKDRVIFIDCYTDWCGPCKYIAANVFTVNEVADYFNGNFVNAKFEMEKSDDGPMLAEKYGVAAYPTFLFIDPHTEELLYIKVGGGEGYRWLLDAGELALDPQMNMIGMERRYAAGERDSELVMNYIKLLGSLNNTAGQAAATEEYLDGRTGDEMFTHETWEILTQSTINPLSEHFTEIICGRGRFYDIEGSEEVDRYLGYAVRKSAEEIVHHIWHPDAFRRVPNADERHTALIARFKEVDEYRPVAIYLAFLETADLVRNRQWEEVLDKMTEVDASGMMNERQAYDYFRYNMIPLGRDGGNDRNIERAREMIAAKRDKTKDAQLQGYYRDLYNQVKFLGSQ